ncbi:polyhydroxyalkanoic acid system family protein [Chitinophaga sp. 22620]|jgi:putative polyhydroxyalkanoate system protein|uniref:polyhydroxyalkanoic acid system family protein n=1 Tax=Chitinophaga sp. 22620 TaxID=3453952 RepID=UPI003F8548FB
MSKLTVNIPHSLSKDEAQQRIQQLLTNLKEQQADKISDVKETWEGDNASFSFSIKGFDISGGIQVKPESVDIEGDLPFALSFFKGMIADLITTKAKELLA